MVIPPCHSPSKRNYLTSRGGATGGGKGGDRPPPKGFKKKKKKENMGYFHALKLALLSSLMRKYMLWEGFYHDFSTKRVSASGDFAPWPPPRGSAPWTPARGRCPLDPRGSFAPLMIYPGAAPAYIYSLKDKYNKFSIYKFQPWQIPGCWLNRGSRSFTLR